MPVANPMENPNHSDRNRGLRWPEHMGPDQTSMSKLIFNLLTWKALLSIMGLGLSYLHRITIQYLQQDAKHSIILDRQRRGMERLEQGPEIKV